MTTKRRSNPSSRTAARLAAKPSAKPASEVKTARKSGKSAGKKDVGKPAVHAVRHFKVWRLVWVIIGVLALLFGIGLVLFVANRPFRERADEWYYVVYSAVHIDSKLNDLASKQANIPYCGTDSRFQKLDVYLPKNSVGLVPAAVYIHGGGWSVGDKSSTLLTKYGDALLQQGIALVSINYRLAPHYHYPVQNQDVTCAIQFLHANGAEYGLDGDRLGVWGDSGGGQLAAIAALDPATKPLVKAVVELYGTSDVWAQINRKPADHWAVAYIGSTANRDRQRYLAQRASPLDATITSAPPFLLFHGTNDRTVAYGQSVAFQKKLQAAGVDATLRTVSHANHNFSEDSQPSLAAIKNEMAQFFKDKLTR